MGLSAYSLRAGNLIAESLAGRLGLPAVPGNVALAFAVQVRREVADGAAWAAGVVYDNPLNLTSGGRTIWWPGQIGYYSGGDSTEWHSDFSAFGSLEAGCAAGAQNYAAGSYPGVVAAFRTGDAVALAEAIEASPWSSDHYGYALAEEVLREMPAAAEGADDMTDEQMVEIVGAIKGAAASTAVYLWRQQHGLDVLSGGFLRTAAAKTAAKAAGARLSTLLAEGKVGEVVSALDRTA